MLASAIAAQSAALPNSAPSYGYSYNLPQEWTIVALRASSSAPVHPDEQKPSVAEEKKGTACIDVPLTARHGDPATTVVIDALPFNCFGQKLTEADLEGFASGAAEGLKQAFDVTDPVTASYTLAGHAMWIERAHALTKKIPATPYTLEIVCTLLQQAAVCWVARAASEPDLKTFEQTPVTLDGSSAPALVPENVFATASKAQGPA